MNKKDQINWPNLLFLAITPILAPFAAYHWFSSGSFNWSTIILTVVLYFAFAMSITAGYHRLFSHRSYDASWIVKFIFLMIGAGAFQGSALVWSLDHRVHHRYVDDNERDPYSINRGFWFAHITWLFFKGNDQLKDSKNAPDLTSDPLVMFQHNNYILLASFFCFGFPALIAASWGDALGGFLIAGLVRVVLNHHGTFLINSACHMIGDQTYSEDHSARDSWITAIFTCGEGYHNYHHEYPSDYRNGIRWYDFDPTKWLVHALYRVGLTSNLKRVSLDRVLLKKLLLQEKQLKLKLSNQPKTITEYANKYIEQIKANVQPVLDRCSKLNNELKALANDKGNKHQRKIIKLELKNAYSEFKSIFSNWESMVYEINKKLVPVRA